MPAALHRLDDYGNVLNVVPLPQPGGRAMGLFDPAADYRALDLVAWNGCEWRAKVDSPGICPGPNWMLSAKGARGKPGRDGKSVTGFGLAGSVLVLRLSDGSELRADLAPLFARER